MVKVFQDLLWSLCFVVSGDWMLSENKHHHKNEAQTHIWAQSFWYKNVAIPLICLFPLWLRFNQCLRRYLDTGKRVPNLPNAFKYAVSQTVTLFGTFHPLYLMSGGGNDSWDVSEHDGELVLKHRSSMFQIFWMCLFIASSLYSFFWDVYMDWGLGRKEVSVFLTGCTFRELYRVLNRCIYCTVWLSWPSADVPQQKLLLYGNWRRFDTEIHVGTDFGSSRFRYVA